MTPIRKHTTDAAPPKGARKARRYPEAELQRALVRRLRAAGQAPVFVENESPRDPAQASRWSAMGGARGVPDLLLPLRRVAVECKSPTGTVKPHQEAWHEALRDCGWLVFVARSESDVPTWVLDGKEEPNDAGRSEAKKIKADSVRQSGTGGKLRGPSLGPFGTCCYCGFPCAANANVCDECFAF